MLLRHDVDLAKVALGKMTAVPIWTVTRAVETHGDFEPELAARAASALDDQFARDIVRVPSWSREKDSHWDQHCGYATLERSGQELQSHCRRCLVEGLEK